LEHINFQKLVSYFDQLLEPSERERVQSHLAQCQPCRRRLQEIQWLLQDIPWSKRDAPSPDLISRAAAAFRHRKPATPQQTYLAALDQSYLSSGVGVRGGSSSADRLYVAGPFEVSVQTTLERPDATWSLRGQFLSTQLQVKDLEGIWLTLSRTDHKERLGLTGRFGEFGFSQLMPGTFSLQAAAGSYEVKIETLTVG
jgi:hypothetical protein